MTRSVPLIFKKAPCLRKNNQSETECMTQEVSLICGALALTNLRYILARANLLPCYFQKACNSYWNVITQTVVSVWSLIFWKAVGVCLPQVRPQVHNGLLKHLSPTVTMIGCFSSVRVFLFIFSFSLSQITHKYCQVIMTVLVTITTVLFLDCELSDCVN